MDKRNCIALDFDGVLHTYDKGWQDGSIYGDPLPGAVEAVQALAKEYKLIIFTCRTPIDAVHEWVKLHFGLEIEVTNGKPHADMYIDDRGWYFQDWETTLHEVTTRSAKSFKRQQAWREEFGWASYGTQTGRMKTSEPNLSSLTNEGAMDAYHEASQELGDV